MQNLEDVHNALVDRGFIEFTPWIYGVYKYLGQLHTSQGSIDIELTLNKMFDKPPNIRIIKVPDNLKPLAPHIGAKGSLCYSISGTIAMDIFNPASQVLACIDRATKILSLILDGELVDDLANEFFVHWDFAKSTIEQLYLDTKDTHSGYVRIFGISNTEGKIISMVITDDRLRTQKKFEKFGLIVEDVSLPGCIIETTANPYPITDGTVWPPTTLDEFIDWQYSLDTKVAGKIMKRIKAIYDSGERFALILISSPTSKYSANLTMPKLGLKLTTIAQARKYLGSCKIGVMSTIRIDDSYMVERNQPSRKNLMGKKILLIGAGAIGGHLADLLVRSGTGFSGGNLMIIDKDSLGVGNIGRHKLGYESLYSFKSIATEKQLKNSFPTANVNSSTLDVKDFPFSTDYDLIINATGEQALSDWLSVKINQDQFIPTINVWIEGPGAVVRTILQPKKSNACYRCLTDINRKSLYPAVNEEYEITLGGHGCESLYVEFPATAALFAASLASNHIMDWLNIAGTPFLRTMVIDRNYSLNTIDQNPIKQIDCPACHFTKSG